jgi:hypothetical protein
MGSMRTLVLGIDPGLTIGIATILVENNTIKGKNLAQVRWGDDFVKFLTTWGGILHHDTQRVIVMEDFALLEKKALQQARNKHSRKMEVVQAIGAVKFWCATTGLKLVLQEPALNDSNAKESGVKIPKNHAVSHKVIAYNHAHHYLVENKIIRHRIHAAYED